MISIRIVAYAAMACALPGLMSCALQETGPDAEQQLSEHHLSCLSAARPAYSPAHVECVLARYQERQIALERLRVAVLPPPPPAQAPVYEKPPEWPDRTPWLN
jgi:hypothetical protein